MGKGKGDIYGKTCMPVRCVKLEVPQRFLLTTYCSIQTKTGHDSLTANIYKNGGGGGFFLACKEFGRMTIHSPPVLFFYFLVEISLHKLIPLSRPGSVHTGSASQDDCDRMFPDKLHVGLFPERFPHSAWTST